MRSFEEDFEFDFDDGLRASRIRIDSRRAVIHDPNRDDNIKHQARIAAHTDRVQRELQELGITKGSKE